MNKCICQRCGKEHLVLGCLKHLCPKCEKEKS